MRAPGQQSDELSLMFHLVGTICVLLSLFVTPLIELVPMIMFYFLQEPLLQSKQPALLLALHFVLVVVVLLLSIAIIIVLAVFTFGIGLVLLIFFVPMMVVAFQLASIMPRSPSGNISLNAV